MQKDLKKKIISKVKAKKNSKKATIISPFNLKTGKKNQFVAFFKPESFIDKTEKDIEAILDLVFEKFDEYGVEIKGSAHFPGPYLAELGIMDRHYGAINKLSKNASTVLTEEQRKKVYQTFGLNEDVRILGGHEAHEISGMTEDEFDKYWLQKNSTKLGSGFHAHPMKIGDELVVVVNGFHPNQLKHFSANGHSTILFIGESDTAWSDIRDKMLGITFPESAEPDSIRGILYKNPKKYGFEKVAKDNNVLHVSAGPTEALFEMDNFLNNAFGIQILESDAVLPSKLILEGFTVDEIRKMINSKEVNDALENKDTDEAIEFLKTYQRS